MLSRYTLCNRLIVFCIPFLVSCNTSPGISSPLDAQFPLAPIRFLLTFDDGPSAALCNNPTQHIINILANNQIQSNVKAIFFVQTRAARSGGTDIGQGLLHRANTEGHLLAFHTATKRHDNHRFLKLEKLDSSLEAGIGDLTTISGVAPKFVRPPFWSYNAATISSYNRYGLHMLLTDLSANDGKIYGVNWSWRKRSNLLHQLRRVKLDLAAGRIPAVDGSIPIIVTFHDVNSYTARNMEVYMQILLQVAQELDLPMAKNPFYDDRAQLEKAALARTVRDVHEEPYIPGMWGWIWGLRWSFDYH